MDKTISPNQQQNQNLDNLNSSDLYKLSYQVQHHTKALRSITTNKFGMLATGSLDGVCAIFQKKENHYSHILNTQHHKDSPIYIVRSSVDDNFIFTGAKDAVINMMDFQGNLLKDFIGHTKIVNSISQAEPDCFISGSWDGTAIVWDIESSRNMFQLEGHSHAVTTLALPNKKFITASQDKAIKFWDADKLVRTVELAHEDIIRSIILDDSSDSFYTCSNDTVIKQWTMDGRMIGKLEEHEGFLFTICKRNGILFSGGDDKVVKYWRNSKVLGELYHPNTIWDLACDESGDLITACGDGAFRVFTRHSDRWMNEKDLQEYNELCLGSGQGEEPGNANEINPDTLIPISDLESTPGKEGEIKLFNDKGMGVAYVKKDGNWNLIGEVMQVKSTKKYYPGDKYFPEGEYDYIFDVELQGTYTKIPINKDDNCLVASERFLTRENLHRNYLDDVTKFLRENVKSQNKLNEPKKPAGPKKKKLDVFNQYKFPKFEKNLYDSLELDKPFQKILEFNQALLEDHQYSDYCLNEERTKILERMVNKVKDKLQHDFVTFEDDEIELFFFNVLKWPLPQLIPVLDLARMFCLLKFMDKDYSNNYWKHQIYNRILECFESGQQNHKILSLRILNNFFKGPRGCEMMESKLSELLPILANFKNETNKSIRSAVSGILMNYSAEIYIKNLEINFEFVTVICDFIKTETEGENMIDLLYAICNMCSDNKKNTGIAKETGFNNSLKRFEISRFDINERQFIDDLIEYFDDFTN